MEEKHFWRVWQGRGGRADGCRALALSTAAQLAVVQAAKVAGATSIAGIDLNPGKFEIAKQLGATHCVNPKDFASDDECKKKLLEGH